MVKGAECVLVRGTNGWKPVTHTYEYLFESRGSGLGCKACARNFAGFWVFGVGSGVGTDWALVGVSGSGSGDAGLFRFGLSLFRRWLAAFCLLAPVGMTDHSRPRPRELHSRRESILSTWLVASAALVSAIESLGQLHVAKGKTLSARGISAHQLAQFRHWEKGNAKPNEHRTVTATAAALYLTPSAVSQRLAALSRSIGTPLLLRQGRGVRLTPQALVLLERGELVQAQLERARWDLARLDAGEIGTVTIGASATALQGLVVPSMSILLCDRPGIAVVIEEAEAPECFRGLDAGAVDPAITVDYALGPSTNDSRYQRLCCYAIRYAS